jgi:hypothetical protein
MNLYKANFLSSDTVRILMHGNAYIFIDYQRGGS